jgi:hypothetical protein
LIDLVSTEPFFSILQTCIPLPVDQLAIVMERIPAMGFQDFLFPDYLSDDLFYLLKIPMGPS